MICPNCANESNGSKHCAYCGLRLELDDISVDTPIDVNLDNQGIYEDKFEGENSSYKNVTRYSHLKTNPDKLNKNLKIIIGIVSALAVILTILLVVRLSGGFKGDKSSLKDSPKVLEESNIESIIKEGKEHLESGDYESCESVFKTAIEKDSKNEEARLLYDIVFNYNRAVKKLESKKFEDARTFYEKIPYEYINYSIYEDIEALDDLIYKYENMNEHFETFEKEIKKKDYDEAYLSASFIDKAYLSEVQVLKFDDYMGELNDYLQNEKKKESRILTDSEAKSLITNYYKAYMGAVKTSKSFNHISTYLTGDALLEQKDKYIEDLNLGNEISFEISSFKSFESVDDTTYIIYGALTKTTNSQTENISDTKDVKFTIKYEESSFYISRIEE